MVFVFFFIDSVIIGGDKKCGGVSRYRRGISSVSREYRMELSFLEKVKDEDLGMKKYFV